MADDSDYEKFRDDIERSLRKLPPFEVTVYGSRPGVTVSRPDPIQQSYGLGSPYSVGQRPTRPFAPTPYPHEVPAPPRGGGAGGRGGATETPLGEPPPDEPLYESYDADVLDREAAELAKQKAWQKFGSLIVGIGRALNEGINFLTYSADAGLSAEQESAIVSQGLIYPWTLVFGPYSEYVANPYNNPNIDPDPYAEPEPTPLPIVFPKPLPAPTTEVVVVGRPLTSPRGDPLASPFGYPSLQPYPITTPLAFPTPKPAPRVGDRPSTKPLPITLPTTITNLLRPPGFNFMPSPANMPLPQPGEKGAPASPQDCQCTKTKPDKKDKKKRKKRDVCYRGIYYERADGLTKYRREKIQCR